MIVQLLGTSGSGKTYLAKGVARCYGQSRPLGPQKRPEAYEIVPRKPRSIRLYLLGSYENECGGVDTIGSVDELLELIWKYDPKGHVLFEGLLISTYLGRLHAGLSDRNIVRYFLDTPIDICIDRVIARRRAQGNMKPLNEDNTRNRVRAIESVRKKVGGDLISSDQKGIDILTKRLLNANL